MSKRWAIAVTLCFFLPLAGLGLYSAWHKDAAVSERENRALAQRPPFSLAELFSGRWTRAFTEYYTDQFPGRETLIRAGERLDQFLYIPVENGLTSISGAFDLGEGEGIDYPDEPVMPAPSPSPRPSPQPSPSSEPSPTPEPSPSPTPEPEPSPEPSPTPEPVVDAETGGYLIIGDRIMHMSYTSETNCRAYADMLGRLQDALPDSRVISMVVPNSFPFYAPSNYVQGSRDQKQMIENLYAMYDERIIPVDAYTPIAAHKDEYLFFRSDHHWTARGAYWAYTGFCDALGYAPSDISEWESGEYTGFIGSFYREVSQQPAAAAIKNNPDVCEYFVPPTAAEGTRYANGSMTGGQPIPVVNTHLSESNSNKYVCFINGDQPVIRYNTEVKNGKSIAVVKESYGNAVIPFLIAHYEDVYVIDYRKFNRDDLPKLSLAGFVEDNGIGDVMLISYPYVPNEKGFTGWIAKMMP